MDQFLLRGREEEEEKNSPSTGQDLLSAAEAQRLVEQLRALPIEEYGSPAFLEQHDHIVSLGLQAHRNAAARGDEFVAEALASHGRVDALIGSLLVAEAWSERLLPLLRDHLADRVDSVVSWGLLFQEAAVASLLEAALFHRSTCEAASDDALMELADWAHRKLLYLNSGAAHRHAAETAKVRTAAEMLAATPREDLDARRAEVEWTAALCGLAVARYLAEHSASLPLCVASRLASVNDTALALVPLVERPPWLRVRSGGRGGGGGGGAGAVEERYEDSAWRAVAPQDRQRLGRLDAQVWLALHALLLEPACRPRHASDEHRRDALLRLRPRLTEPLLDQLPPLVDLQRLLDATALGASAAEAPGPSAASRLFAGGGGEVPSTSNGAGTTAAAATAAASSRLLLVEHVPQLRARLVQGRDWPKLAARLKSEWLGDAAARLARERAERMLRAFEFMCGGDGGDGGGGGEGAAEIRSNDAASHCDTATKQSADMAAVSSKKAPTAPAVDEDSCVRVECWRRVRAGFHERWCDLSCEVDGAHAPQEVAVKGADGGGGGGGDGCEARGLRHRLVPLDAGKTRPLPCDGKIVVRFRGRRAAAQLQLPSVAVRSLTADVPAGLWLTVGLLAADGIALQLRLRRADRPVERDAASGAWCAYHPVGGAVTLLQPEREEQQQQQQQQP